MTAVMVPARLEVFIVSGEPPEETAEGAAGGRRREGREA
jgi:hypothetical protein